MKEFKVVLGTYEMLANYQLNNNDVITNSG